jgi:hypothetical protein
MFRSLLPFALAILGFALILSTINMPLFTWQISEIVTDFPATYDVRITPSPWTAHLGDSLDDGSFVFIKIYIQREKSPCREENLSFIVRRSQKDEALEQVLNFDQENTLWPLQLSIVNIILSVVYIWWFTIWREHRSVFLAVIFTMISGCIFVYLTQIMKGFAGPLNHIAYFGTIDCYGTVTFNAALSEVHYETLFVLFVATAIELGALGVMLRQIVKAVIERKEASKSAVG